MPPPLAFKSLALRPRARTLTLVVEPGDAFAVMSPQPEGGAMLLNVAGGRGEPAEGYVERSGEVRWAGVGAAGWRQTPQAIAKRSAGDLGSVRVAEALSAVGLWDDRRRPLSALSELKRVAAALLPVIAGSERILIVDGQLDVLGPWVFEVAMDALRRRLSEGACLLATTNRPDVARALGKVVVLREGGARFAGTTDQLIQRAKPARVEIVTTDRQAAMALVGPLNLQMEETENGLILEAEHGRELAARMVVEGYGAVRLVAVREPTLAEALETL